MATNLQIDERLLREAQKLGNLKTKRETVNEALAEYVRRREQLKILDLVGTLKDSDFWDAPSLPRRKNGSRRNGTAK
ncbi:MAG: type II toxin-antitoxin system VapB family antitoxin [Planctomycetota bacterium]|nr:type II toxin-antitoxin system VapB family antitoxin [Planctomycetota bacterium]